MTTNRSNISLTDDDRQALDLYRKQFDSFRSRSFFKADTEAITLETCGGDKTGENLEGVDDEHLQLLLVYLRPFILPKELTSVRRIHGIIFKNCPDQHLRKWSVFGCRGWKKSLRIPPIEIIVNGTYYTPERIIDLFLYGGIVHRDSLKVEELDCMDPIVRGQLKLNLVIIVQRLYPILRLFDRIIWYWLEVPERSVPESPQYHLSVTSLPLKIETPGPDSTVALFASAHFLKGRS